MWSFSRACCRCDITPLSCNRTEDPDYETYVIAFLPTLKYIDWKRISHETREGAVLKYSDNLEITCIKEAKVEELQAEADARDVRHLYAAAFPHSLPLPHTRFLL